MPPRLLKSKGHIGFTKTHEYFQLDSSKNIYRAPISDYIGTDGYRAGLRFESTPAAWVHQAPKIEWVKKKGRK
jgi:hypothetical protein